MKIAPIDIRQQRFSVKFRGFDPQEVDTFLEMVADELEDMVRENDRLKEQQKKLEMQIEELGANEAGVRKTLLAAQTLREDISANAKKEAELIIRDAHSKANEIIGSMKEAATGARDDLAALARRKKQLVLNMRSMMETHLRMLEAEERNDLSVNEALPLQSAGAGPGASENPPPGNPRKVEVNEAGRSSPLKAEQAMGPSGPEASLSVFLQREHRADD